MWKKDFSYFEYKSKIQFIQVLKMIRVLNLYRAIEKV